MKYKFIILVAVLFLIPLSLHAESARKYIDQGITKAQDGDIKGAISDFNKAIKKSNYQGKYY